MLLRVTRVTTGTLIKDWKRMKYPIHFGLEKAGLPLILTIENPKNLCFLIDANKRDTLDKTGKIIYNLYCKITEAYGGSL
jgi:hypothetical protein